MEEFSGDNHVSISCIESLLNDKISFHCRSCKLPFDKSEYENYYAIRKCRGCRTKEFFEQIESEEHLVKYINQVFPGIGNTKEVEKMLGNLNILYLAYLGVRDKLIHQHIKNNTLWYKEQLIINQKIIRINNNKINRRNNIKYRLKNK